MIWRSLLIWVVGASTLAYTPSASEILSGMEAVLRKGKPVEAKVIRQHPDGQRVEEAVLTIPDPPDSIPEPKAALDLPFSVMTMPLTELGRILPTVVSEDVRVSLGRTGGEVCYILEGGQERLWISKGGLLPLKIEFLGGEHLGTTYVYLDMIPLSEQVRYPARTEVWRNGELVLVERLIPATASTGSP